MKVIFLIIGALMLAACSSHAPEPKQAKGDWYDLNTTIQAVKAGTY
ncbi:traF protein [Salmonella enterica]|nr:traF protein [Salmonella enterica]